jgi:hypothetical protein
MYVFLLGVCSHLDSRWVVFDQMVLGEALTWAMLLEGKTTVSELQSAEGGNFVHTVLESNLSKGAY